MSPGVTSCHPATPAIWLPPSICFGVFHSQCCHSLFLERLYLHALPCDLECVSHGGWRAILLRAHSGFCKCKQLILSRPAGCSTQLSVNRRKIMFIRARNRCIPPTHSTPPATNSFSSTSLLLPRSFSSTQPLSALSPETGCSL